MSVVLAAVAAALLRGRSDVIGEFVRQARRARQYQRELTRRQRLLAEAA
jgi:hypothetical protein